MPDILKNREVFKRYLLFLEHLKPRFEHLFATTPYTPFGLWATTLIRMALMGYVVGLAYLMALWFR